MIGFIAPTDSTPAIDRLITYVIIGAASGSDVVREAGWDDLMTFGEEFGIMVPIEPSDYARIAREIDELFG